MTQLDFTQASESTTFDYEGLRAKVAYRANLYYQAHEGYVFETDTTNLFDTFLNALHPSERQHYSCNTCRQFFNRFGGLVVVDELTGEFKPLLWELSPDFETVQDSIYKQVKKSKIVSPFYVDKTELGHEHLGGWSHFFVKLDTIALRNKDMALLKQNFIMLKRYLSTVSNGNIHTLQTMITEGMLGLHSAQYNHMVNWLVQVADNYHGLKGKRADNYLWLAVYKAPKGYAHVKNTVIGQVLDMMSNHVPLDQIKASFSTMTDSRNYQRPKAAPSTGNIKEANKRVAELGLERSFERRFCTVQEIAPHAVWLPNMVQEAPAIPKTAKNGFFDRLQANTDYTLDAHVAATQHVSMQYFVENVLGKAKNITYTLRSRENFKAMVTAVHPDSPPILKWDLPHARNPVSWYVKDSASPAAAWGLMSGQEVNITGIFSMPFMWNKGNGSHWPTLFDSLVFCIQGCKDQNVGGLALFPQILNNDLRDIRSTIEAYSNQGVLADTAGPYANLASGLSIGRGTILNGFVFMVESATGVKNRYEIKSLV